jgi:LysM repeat protein
LITLTKKVEQKRNPVRNCCTSGVSAGNNLASFFVNGAERVVTASTLSFRDSGQSMQKFHLGQILVGAALLTAAFYFGINYKVQPAPEMNSVAELANEDLTLKKPLLPPSETETQTKQLQNPVAKSAPLQAPSLTKPEQQIPQLQMKPGEVAAKFQEQSVEPDFSRIKSLPEPATSSILDRGQFSAEPLVNSNTRETRDAFKPLIPPTMPQDNSTLITPEISQLDLPAQSPAAQRATSSSLLAIPERQLVANPNRKSSFQVHVIRSGETLQSIAKRYYHSDEYYLEIYVANQDVLPSPIRLPAGTTIKIPDLANRSASANDKPR